MKGIGNPYEASIGDLQDHPEVLQILKDRNEPDIHAYKDSDVKQIYKMIQKGLISTIDELESWVYKGSFLNKNLTSATSGFVNTIYGRFAWDQVNREANLFGLLKKVVWSHSGWRVITPESTNTASYTIEGGTIPAGEDPAISRLSVTPTSIVIRNNRSDVLDALAQLDDGVDIETVRQWLEQRHRQIINLELLGDAGSASTATTHLIPIDRIIGSYAEIAYGKSDNSAVIPANYLDVYSQNRDSAASWVDSQVLGQAYGLADRPLTLSLLDTAIEYIRTNGGAYDNNLVMVTHPETATRIDQLLRNNQRFEEMRGITYLKGGKGGMTNLGPEPRVGIEGGFKVKTYDGIPIFEDKNVVQDVSLGRIYLINLDHLFIGTLMPTRFYQWQGPETTSSFDINMLYRTVGQVVCTNFRKQGKIRDLSA